MKSSRELQHWVQKHNPQGNLRKIGWKWSWRPQKSEEKGDPEEKLNSKTKKKTFQKEVPKTTNQWEMMITRYGLRSRSLVTKSHSIMLSVCPANPCKEILPKFPNFHNKINPNGKPNCWQQCFKLHVFNLLQCKSVWTTRSKKKNGHHHDTLDVFRFLKLLEC